MDVSLYALAVSVVVAVSQLVGYFRSNLRTEIDYMKKDIIEIKIQNGICAADRYNNNDDIKTQIRLLEKLSDKLDGI